MEKVEVQPKYAELAVTAESRDKTLVELLANMCGVTLVFVKRQAQVELQRTLMEAGISGVVRLHDSIQELDLVERIFSEKKAKIKELGACEALDKERSQNTATKSEVRELESYVTALGNQLSKERLAHQTMKEELEFQIKGLTAALTKEKSNHVKTYDELWHTRSELRQVSKANQDLKDYCMGRIHHMEDDLEDMKSHVKKSDH
ncbi:hypothetical protein Pelo_7939 [Pelomyxa schiedti]|nr:hypothetical protein Pelo_7939 [Pelomyxa schiedti]